jgi:hypothetical protein
MKEEAIKSNPGKEIIISIAVVSEGGRRNIVQEMRKASLEAGGGKGGKKFARHVKIVSKEGKNYWRNPTAQETSDIGKEGFMIYDGEYNHFLAEHVEAFLHNHIKANTKNESIRLLQTISGNGGTKSSGPFKVGMCTFICDAYGNPPLGLIWTEKLPKNIPYLEQINLKICSHKELVDDMMYRGRFRSGLGLSSFF